MTRPSGRSSYEYLDQWLSDNPQAALKIAKSAIWGLYANPYGGRLEDPEGENPVSGADYIEYLSGVMENNGVYVAVNQIRHRERNKLLPAQTHWLVTGRIPGAYESVTEYVVVPADSSPAFEFMCRLYGDDEEAIKAYKEGSPPTLSENPHGEWLYIDSTFQIHGPPIN